MKEYSRQRQAIKSFEDLSLAGVLVYGAAMPFFQHALRLASALPLVCLWLFLPLLWLMFGTVLCLGTILLKKLAMPSLSSDRPIQLWSLDFARWWLVHRAIATTNHLFARRLRGTAFLASYLRALVRHTLSLLVFLTLSKGFGRLSKDRNDLCLNFCLLTELAFFTYHKDNFYTWHSSLEAMLPRDLRQSFEYRMTRSSYKLQA